jgi:CDP-glucose 4,6-dehydratase
VVLNRRSRILDIKRLRRGVKMLTSFKDKVVLVTGATGFLGGHVVERLLSREAEVVGLVHDHHKVCYLNLENINVSHTAQGDITDVGSIRRIIADYEVEYVFHLAADPIVRKCILDPVGCFETNILGTAKVLEACRQVGTVKGVLCMESDKAYGSFDSEDLPYREDQALKPSNVYEVSKACAGYVSKAYDSNYDLPTFTIRGANLYGPGDMNVSRIMPGSILRVLKGERPVLYGGVGDYIREFIYVYDAAEVCVQLMEQIDKVRGLPINLGTGDVHRVSDVMETLCSLMGTDLKPQIVEKANEFKEIEEQKLDLTRLRSFIPDYSFLTIEQGLRNTIDWYVRHFREGV